jgi:hypothetical protein
MFDANEVLASVLIMVQFGHTDRDFIKIDFTVF